MKSLTKAKAAGWNVMGVVSLGLLLLAFVEGFRENYAEAAYLMSLVIWLKVSEDKR